LKDWVTKQISRGARLSILSVSLMADEILEARIKSLVQTSKAKEKSGSMNEKVQTAYNRLGNEGYRRPLPYIVWSDSGWINIGVLKRIVIEVWLRRVGPQRPHY
jgi:hypothetical protein